MATQLTVPEETSNASEMVGSAMLTMMPSKADMKVAREMEKNRRKKGAWLRIERGMCHYKVFPGRAHSCV